MKTLPLIASAILLAPSAMAQATDHSTHDHSEHAPPAQETPADPHAGHQMPDHAMSAPDMAGHAMTMSGALGPNAMSREGSGTSWVPDASHHGGLHADKGAWTYMAHAVFDGVYTSQDGPRGDNKAFAGGMIMGVARRDFANGDVLQFRGMISPDPLMGKSGYPLLLAAGETADGAEPLVDRQHPHDLFMELSASYSTRLSDRDSLYVYAGLPGEPAFGPPAFMHRPAAAASPEAPITHHWLDSTHITFGVATVGWVHDDWKVEASRFRGREPDENRYDIETGALDSTAFRVSWNPSARWALQASWAEIISPEGLEPDENEDRVSVSALYTRPLVNGGEISVTGAFARKDRSDGVQLDAWLGEAAWKPNSAWTIFSRAEAIETDELGADHHGPVEEVAKISLGVVRDFRITDTVVLGLGAQVSQNRVSDTLSPLYGGDPTGAMAFVRIRVG